MSQLNYYLAMPVNVASGVVFASPHSGRDYPESFLQKTILNANVIRSSEDAFVDQLFAYAPDHGCPVATFARIRGYRPLPGEGRGGTSVPQHVGHGGPRHLPARLHMGA